MHSQKKRKRHSPLWISPVALPFQPLAATLNEKNSASDSQKAHHCLRVCRNLEKPEKSQLRLESHAVCSLRSRAGPSKKLAALFQMARLLHPLHKRCMLVILKTSSLPFDVRDIFFSAREFDSESKSSLTLEARRNVSSERS